MLGWVIVHSRRPYGNSRSERPTCDNGMWHCYFR
jgi:hypothetical protein